MTGKPSKVRKILLKGGDVEAGSWMRRQLCEDLEEIIPGAFPTGLFGSIFFPLPPYPILAMPTVMFVKCKLDCSSLYSSALPCHHFEVLSPWHNEILHTLITKDTSSERLGLAVLCEVFSPQSPMPQPPLPLIWCHCMNPVITLVTVWSSLVCLCVMVLPPSRLWVETFHCEDPQLPASSTVPVTAAQGVLISEMSNLFQPPRLVRGKTGPGRLKSFVQVCTVD